MLAHAFLFALSLLVAFALAYNLHGLKVWLPKLYLPLLILVLPIKLIVFGWMRQFRGSWRYVGLRDLVSIAIGSQISSFIYIAVLYLSEAVLHRRVTGSSLFGAAGSEFRQSAVFLIDWAATIGLVSIARILVRFYYEYTRGQRNTTTTRILIVGANDHGENLLREILRTPELGYEVVGIVDDSVAELKHRIHGVEVIGRTPELPEICAAYEIDELLIAMPEAQPRALRAVMGDPSWAQRSVLDGADGRLEHREEIDAELAQWTEKRDPRAAMETLQAVGVPAGVPILDDPQPKTDGIYFLTH